jgi:hypothetical protein
MTYWLRSHVNGWTAEVWLGEGFFFHHRVFHSGAVPADFADAKHDLQSAQAAADRTVPPHDCRACAAWTAWRWCPHARRSVAVGNPQPASHIAELASATPAALRSGS